MRSEIITEFAKVFPGMPAQGYTEKFLLPPPSEALLASFENMPFDHYAPQAQRYRRFSQYLTFFNAQHELTLVRLPRRPFIQAAVYNPLSGGILRQFAPIDDRCDIGPYTRQIFDILQCDPARKYHLDVHQYRVVIRAKRNQRMCEERV